MTGADTIGFHTNDYTQHFLKSVKRALGYKAERNYIMINDRLCKADTFPIGIDYEKFNSACDSKKTIVYKDKLRNHIGENKLVFSIDRLDYSKGFIFRLKAYERFLEKYPEWHFKVVFNMIVIPSRDNIEGYRKIKREIEATVGRINGRYSNLSWVPVTYQYKSVPFNELVAIYNMSDVGLITPVRDGMNLVAKEFVACQNGKYGMLVLSEMAGAANELSESVLINPTDADEVADSINEALTLPEDEKQIRMLKMQNRLSRYNVFTWAKDFFEQVKEVKREQDSLQSRFMDEKIMHRIKSAYTGATRRLLLFDYDGTLTPMASTPDKAVLSKTTREVLNKIISDRKNEVVIISGRRKEFLNAQFSGLNAVLVAEHGYFVRYPGKEWDTVSTVDLSWKSKVMPLMDDYVDKCSGTFIEEKEASLAWHYRNADDDMISLRLNDLKNALSSILRTDEKLLIMDGEKVLEVKSFLYDKGSVAASMIRNGSYDFILAAGDDHTDEDLFRVVPDDGITIKVGNKPTSARFNIRDQRQMPEILNLLVS